MKDFTSQQAEVEILGRIMIDPKAFFRVNELIRPDDFATPSNKLVYKAMIDCEKAGKPLELGILAEYLKTSDIRVSDLMDISSKVASTSDIRHYAEILVESSKKRRLQEVMAQSQARIPGETFSSLSQWITSEIYRIDDLDKAGKCIDRGQLMNEVVDFIDKGIQSNGENVGMKTEWKSIDTALAGFKRGDLVVIGARPSMGKTAFALNLSDKLSGKYKILFFELEMPALKLGLRELAARSYIPMSKLYEPQNLSESEVRIVMETIHKIAEKSNVTIDDKPQATLDHIRNRVRNLKYSQGVDVVVVDHIGLIKDTKRGTSRNDWLGEVSSTLKAIAKEFDVCVIALSQLNRGVEARTGNRPQLSDLRESGNIEQDADVVLLLYRAGYYSKDKVPENESLEVIVAKNRDGKTGTVNMAINLKKQLVTEIYK